MRFFKVLGVGGKMGLEEKDRVELANWLAALSES